jgi:hypothetical protein
MSLRERLSKMVLLSGAMLGGVVFCYYLYFYHVSGERQFGSPVIAVMCYAGPLAIAVALAVSMRLPQLYRINLCLCLAAVCMSFYAAELVIIYLGHRHAMLYETLWGDLSTPYDQERARRAAASVGVNFDVRRRLDVLLEFRRDGVVAVPPVSAHALLQPRADGALLSAINMHGDECLPLSGMSGVLTVFCNENGQYALYRSDRHGFNNPDVVWDRAHVEIAAVGDSYTQGACVQAEESFVGLIRQRHPGTVNLGMEGNGPVSMLASIKEYLPAVRPKIVLWFYYEENDLLDLSRERRSHLLARYVDGGFSQDLPHRRIELNTALGGFLERAMAVELQRVGNSSRVQASFGIELINFMKLAHLRERASLTLPGGNRARASGDLIAEFKRVLRTAQSVVASWGGVLYIVYLPARDRYVFHEEFNRAVVLDLIKALGLQLIDVKVAFSAHGDPLSMFPFRRFGHYNREGHRIVAETVLHFISTSPRRESVSTIR